MRLTDFWVVSRACVEISSDPAKSNQFLTLNFFVNVIPGKSISASFENIIFKIFWGSIPQDPPRMVQKIFRAAARLQLFLARNLTLNYYNKLANMYCNRFSSILYIVSDNSLITLMKSGMTTKYWFVKI